MKQWYIPGHVDNWNAQEKKAETFAKGNFGNKNLKLRTKSIWEWEKTIAFDIRGGQTIKSVFVINLHCLRDKRQVHIQVQLIQRFG